MTFCALSAKSLLVHWPNITEHAKMIEGSHAKISQTSDKSPDFDPESACSVATYTDRATNINSMPNGNPLCCTSHVHCVKSASNTTAKVDVFVALYAIFTAESAWNA